MSSILFLEVFFFYEYQTEKQIQMSSFLDLRKEFKTESIPHLMAFVLNAKEENKQCETWVYETITYLTAHDLLCIEKLIPHLMPRVEDTAKAYVEAVAKKKKELKNVGSISLNAVASASQPGAQDAPPSTTTDASSLTIDEHNRFLRLATILIQMRARYCGYTLIKCIDGALSRGEIGIGCTLYPPLGIAICRMMHGVLEPLYAKLVRKNLSLMVSSLSHRNTIEDKGSDNAWMIAPMHTQITPIETMDEFISAIYDPVMCIIDSGYIASDPILYCKLVRLFKFFFKNSLSEGSSDAQIVEKDPRIYTLLSVFFIPSLSLFESNAFLSSELWNAIMNLPFEI